MQADFKNLIQTLQGQLDSLLTQATATEEEILPSLELFTSSIHEIASKINCLSINTAIIIEQAHVKHEGLQVIAKEMQMLGEQTEFTLEQMEKKMHGLALALKHQNEKLHEIEKIITSVIQEFNQ